MIDIEKILKQFETVKMQRSSWEASREDIKKYVCPESDRDNDIYASIPSYAASVLASNLQSLLVNPATKWFSVDLYKAEKNEDTLSWCQYIAEKLNEALNYRATNFFSQIHEFFLTLVTYGSGVFYIEEDPKLPYCTFFRNIPLEECYFEDNRFGFVDSIYREFQLTNKVASNIWEKSTKLQKLAEKSPDEKINILHVVRPNEDKKTSKEYISLYIFLEDEEILHEASYKYFPFMVTRWVKHANSSYGFAPAHHVMPDIKLLNEYRKLGIQIKQKQVQPPLLVPLQGYMLPLNMAPGQMNFYQNSTVDKIIPLSNLENIEPTLDEQERCEIAIRAAFFMDVFHLPKENKEMTASEVSVRSEEQMRMMSPIVGRIESELLDPLIHNLFTILLKYKHIDIGSGSKGPEIDINYISPLARAQRLESTRSMENVLVFLANSGAANIAPEIYDNVNWDNLLKLYANLQNCPQNIFNEEKEVSHIRRLRAESQEMMQMNGGET
jgi:Bacteriophage head to tail connecting protein